MGDSLIIIGAGGHGRVCADVAQRGGWNLSGFCDPAFAEVRDVLGVPVLSGSEAELFADWSADTALFAAIGDNTRRLSIISEAARHLVPVAVLVDPAATISVSATLGPGCIVMPGAVVNAEAFIGRGALINTGAVVEHGARIGEGAHVAPGACLTGDAVIGTRTLVGARATILPGVQVGADATVGAGAVVTRDVGDRVTVTGTPARAVRHISLVHDAV